MLPPKQEYVLNIRLSGVQDQLYRRYLEKGRGCAFQASDLFSTFSTMAKVSWLPESVVGEPKLWSLVRICGGFKKMFGGNKVAVLLYTLLLMGTNSNF